MPIAALSENTARAICSSLVLNDAISVIKELIDNALDSKATNIVIEISANTLDIIQVKDNGAGIGVEDRQLLCKRGHTSKIRTFEDLTLLGGKYLGFRGEALASIASLSDNVVITTRVDGETVGTLLKFNADGKLISSSSAAHGTGTTVRVSNFLTTIPVRKQTAVKQTTRILGGIKKLLFDYAFARPTVRIQFKILKSGSDLKANWSFAPCLDAQNLSLLASKIVGKEIAAQCEQVYAASDDESYKVDALLFARDADIIKCSGADVFLSIDGRPLSVERGLMKDLNKVYKSYISSVLPGETASPKKVFLLLRLHCPRGSYDVNVEPAKNEIIFEDPGVIPELFEHLCKSVYGDKATRTPKSNDHRKSRIATTADFDLLLAKKPEPSGSNHTQGEQSVPEPNASSAVESKQAAFHESGSSKEARIFRNMSDLDELDLFAPPAEKRTSTEEDLLEEMEDIMNPHITNPFVLAKMNTRIRAHGTRQHETNALESDSTTSNHVQHEPHRETPRLRESPQNSKLLPSPSPSPERRSPYQNPGPPNRPWKSRQIRDEDDEDEEQRSPESSGQMPTDPKPTLLESWTRSVNRVSSQRELPKLPQPTHTGQSMANGGAGTTSPVRDEHMITPRETVGLQRTGHQPKFRTPFKKDRSVQDDLPVTGDRSLISRVITADQGDVRDACGRSTLEVSHSAPFGLTRPRTDTNDDLSEIMDFEHRKRRTILQHRGRMNPSEVNEATGAVETGTDRELFMMPARPENEGLPPTPPSITYASRFGAADDDFTSIPPQPNSSSYTQNPHFNRYKKALRDLEERASAENIASNNEDSVSATHSAERKSRETKLSLEDPRTYLIRYADHSTSGEVTGKQKRSLTAKLPFETIAPGTATYSIIGVQSQETLHDYPQLTRIVETVGEADSYVVRGSVSPTLNGRPVTTSVIQQWETELAKLLGAACVQGAGSNED